MASSCLPLNETELLLIADKLFQDNSISHKLHNKFVCSKKHCFDISITEKKRLLPKTFNHQRLNQYWWLCFVECEGMYCIICRKHNMKNVMNKRDVFVKIPSTRYINDSLKSHASSSVYKAAIETELVQKMSVFHTEICQKDKVELSVYEQVFSTVYFIMKNFIANRILIPVLSFVENTFDCSNLRFFNHKSKGSQQEIFLTVGETINTSLIEKVKKASTFGILTDEVSDISVTENLVTFIQFFYYETRSVQTSFLACQDVFTKHESANAQAISDLIVDLVEGNGLEISKMTGFSSDGAATMVGKRAGVAALLRKKNPSLINIHCVCHKLALSCTDTNEAINYIKQVETFLRQLWYFFENSPKRMACYLKTQTDLKSIKLGKEANKCVARRLKKACRTRWLSLDASVKALHQDYEAVLHTLSKFEKSDATASGLYKKNRSIIFVGVVYIFADVLPVLSELSKSFQKDSLNFSAIVPAINLAKEKLTAILDDEIPLTKLTSDFDSLENMCSDLKVSKKEMDELKSLFKKYITALIENIEKRFADSSDLLVAFSVLDPLLVPSPNSPGFKQYGVNHITTLAEHFFREDEGKTDKILSEWQSLKYHVDTLRKDIPISILEGSVKQTSTEWFILRILTPSYKQFYPLITYLADAAASLPVTNAWPERGGSCLKNIKTRLRNRLSNKMLQACMHVCINGPDMDSLKKSNLITKAVETWIETKNRRKLAVKHVNQNTSINQQNPIQNEVQVQDMSVQTEPVPLSSLTDREEVRLEVQAAIKKMYLDLDNDEGDDDNEDDEDDEDDDEQNENDNFN